MATRTRSLEKAQALAEDAQRLAKEALAALAKIEDEYGSDSDEPVFDGCAVSFRTDEAATMAYDCAQLCEEVAVLVYEDRLYLEDEQSETKE